jgi:hypothetical protein
MVKRALSQRQIMNRYVANQRAQRQHIFMRPRVVSVKRIQQAKPILRCAYCGKQLIRKWDLKGLIREEDSNFPMFRLFCNDKCVMRFRLNGNRAKNNTQYIYTNTVTNYEAYSRLMYKKERGHVPL